MKRRILTMPVFVVCLLVMVSTVTPETRGLADRDPYLAPAYDNIVWPLDWSGVWTGQSRTYVCETTPGPWESDSKTICGGTYIEEIQSLPPGHSCDVTTLASTSIIMTCEGTREIYLNCFQTIRVAINLSRNGDSMTGSVTTNITHAGTAAGCSSITPTCQQTEIQSNRTGSEPPTCVAAVEPVTWGHVKAVYE
ncbi:MAG: hypothetical protein JSW50_11705 [Candidatus Latescibacterota bacterium]|nr:MAG: hypothetical protein JSW50_11705 [Candidatus Latescibacterota bacterium]